MCVIRGMSPCFYAWTSETLGHDEVIGCLPCLQQQGRKRDAKRGMPTRFVREHPCPTKEIVTKWLCDAVGRMWLSINLATTRMTCRYEMLLNSASSLVGYYTVACTGNGLSLSVAVHCCNCVLMVVCAKLGLPPGCAFRMAACFLTSEIQTTQTGNIYVPWTSRQSLLNDRCTRCVISCVVLHAAMGPR